MKKMIVAMAAVFMAGMAIGQTALNEDDTRAAAMQFVGSRLPAKEVQAGVKLQRVELPALERVAVYNVVRPGREAEGGFVIVSADSRTRRVLGYSDHGSVEPGSMPENVRWWLGQYEEQIAELRDATLEELKANYRQTAGTGIDGRKDGYPDSVAPLLTSTWNQYRNGYNSMVPYDSVMAADTALARMEGHPTVGCVALAMAQVMRYWGFPQHGYGSHAYTHEGEYDCWRYGTLRINYAASTYDYSLMPDQLTATSTPAEVEAVARLMYHCGVACNMRYNSDCQGSSGAFMSNCLQALHQFFHYESDASVARRNSSYTTGWDERLKADLAEGRPVLYAGQSYRNDQEGTAEGGHAFVLDGYDAEGLFHVNWGWGGAYNGYFSSSVLRPMTMYDFTYPQEAIFNLQPCRTAMPMMVMGGNLQLDKTRLAERDTIRGSYVMTNIGDTVAEMFVGLNLYERENGYSSDYSGCVDARRLRLAPGDTAVCRFAYPIRLSAGNYSAVMQYSADSFYAGIRQDVTYYLGDLDYSTVADFVVTDTTYKDLTNLVVFVRFSDDPEIEKPVTFFDSMFNSAPASVARYFEAMSYGKITFNTVFATGQQDTVLCTYVDPHPRGYYMPYSDSNTIGYTTPNPQVGISMREAELIARVADYVDSMGLVPADVELDGNGDGKVDNLSIILQGGVGDWSDLLWPHMEFFPHDSVGRIVTINGRRLHAFNFEFEGAESSAFSIHVFCHEMGHSLGLPDLYHYNHYTGVYPVVYDMMGYADVQPSAILKHKFLSLTSNPIRIEQGGSYTINSSGSHSSNNLHYIQSAIDPNQWYTIEYRSKDDPFETGLPHSGLMIGRWQDTTTCNLIWGGNAFYNPPQVPNAYWVFRPDSENDTVNGRYIECLFDQEHGLTEFGPAADPHPYLADGTPENLFRIYDVRPNGNQCTYSVEFYAGGIGGNESVASAFRLFPNPAHGVVTIALAAAAQQGGPCTVAVFDMMGHEVVRQSVGGASARIDCSAWATGVYFVAVTTPQGTSIEKLTIN